MQTFAGYVISSPSISASGSGTFLVKIDHVSKLVVQLYANAQNMDYLLSAGLGKRGTVTFECEGIFAHDPNYDKVLPPKDGFAATKIHRVDGLKNIRVQVTAKRLDLSELESAPHAEKVYAF